MSRWIDADAISAELRDMARNDYFNCAGASYSTIFEIIAEAIDKMPAADVLVNVKGNWDKNRIAFHWKCSECGAAVFNNLGTVFYYTGNENLNYCPNCGAKMERSEE